jgi:outer membrane protein TolC
LAEWSFEELFLASLYFHPALEIARAQWQVAIGGLQTAAQRPNPVLTVAPGYDVSATGAVNPWIPSVSFDLPLETAGKRAYRRSQAQHLSDAARLAIISTAWHVRSALRSSLVEFAVAKERSLILKTQRSVEARIIQAMEQEVKAGALSSSELTLTRIALTQIELELAGAEQQLAENRVRLADAVGLNIKALDKATIRTAVEVPDFRMDELLSPSVRGRALSGRADILAALAEYAASQSALQLEIAKQFPDIHLGPGYQYDQGDHKISLSLSVELPILNQNRGPIAEAEARRAEAAARFLAAQAKAMFEIDQAAVAIRAAQSNLVVLTALADAHKRRHQTVQAEVAVGAASQLDLLNSQVEVGAGELVRLAGRAKLLQAVGALENAVQRPLDDALLRSL